MTTDAEWRAVGKWGLVRAAAAFRRQAPVAAAKDAARQGSHEGEWCLLQAERLEALLWEVW